jgi:hypothetical protein
MFDWLTTCMSRRKKPVLQEESEVLIDTRREQQRMWKCEEERRLRFQEERDRGSVVAFKRERG